MISSCLIKDIEFEFNFKNAIVLNFLSESFVTYYNHSFKTRTGRFDRLNREPDP